MARRPILAIGGLLGALVVLPLVGCSGSSSDGRAGGTTIAPAAVTRWRDLQANPCGLVDRAAAAKALGVKRLARLRSEVPGVCRWQVTGARVLELELFLPQARSTPSTNRTAGARPTKQPGIEAFTLATLGAGAFARKGRALALVALRTTGKPTAALAATVQELAMGVRSRLPEAPAPGPRLAARAVGAGGRPPGRGARPGAGDPQDPRRCAFYDAKATSIVVGPTPSATYAPTPPPAGKATAWPEVPGRSTWIDSGKGRGTGYVTVGPRTYVISVASGTRSSKQVRRIAATAARRLLAAK